MYQKMRVGHPIPVAVPYHASPILATISNGCVGDNDVVGKMPEKQVSILLEGVLLILLIGNEISRLHIDEHRRAIKRFAPQLTVVSIGNLFQILETWSGFFHWIGFGL